MKTTERTLRMLRAQGIPCAVVERWNSFARRGSARGVRQDLFGIIDVIALRSRRVVGIQSCGADAKEHLDKIISKRRSEALAWLDCADLELWSWRRRKHGKRSLWTVRVQAITKDHDFPKRDSVRVVRGKDASKE